MRRLTSEESAALHRARGETYKGSSAMIKEVRERTGAGMLDCKLVLIACDYDVEKACEMVPNIGLA